MNTGGKTKTQEHNEYSQSNKGNFSSLMLQLKTAFYHIIHSRTKNGEGPLEGQQLESQTAHRPIALMIKLRSLLEYIYIYDTKENFVLERSTVF